MADAKITELSALTTVALADVLPIVDDVAGTPATKKVTVEKLLEAINAATAEASIDGAADYLLVFDTSAAGVRKVLPNNLPSSASVWGNLTGTLADQTDLQAELDAKADAATTLAGYGITDAYTASQADTAISNAISALVDTAPGTLDTLNELAAALGDDADFATTMTDALAGKVDASSLNESIDDRVAALLVAGTGVTLTYDDGAGTLTIAVSGGGGSSAWGSITGTLADQTDLQAALDAKGAIDDQAWTGVHDFGGADSLEIPNGATPTVDAAGEVAIDTTITDLTGLITYHDGTEVLYVIAVPAAQVASPTDKDAAVYSAADNEMQMQGVVTPYVVTSDSLGGELAGDELYFDGDDWTNQRAGSDGDTKRIVDGLPAWVDEDGVTTLSDGATVTLDCSVIGNKEVTLAGNRTLALTNPKRGQSTLLRVIQDGTGSRTLSYPASVKWPGGTAPTLTTTANASDWLGFKCVDAATPVYHGFIVGQGYSA